MAFWVTRKRSEGKQIWKSRELALNLPLKDPPTGSLALYGSIRFFKHLLTSLDGAGDSAGPVHQILKQLLDQLSTRLVDQISALIESTGSDIKKFIHIRFNPRLRDHNLCSAFSISPARSPMMTQGAIVLPAVTLGMMEPSTMRRLSIPSLLSKLAG